MPVGTDCVRIFAYGVHRCPLLSYFVLIKQVAITPPMWRETILKMELANEEEFAKVTRRLIE